VDKILQVFNEANCPRVARKKFGHLGFVTMLKERTY
jgi:hypothetical protein